MKNVVIHIDRLVLRGFRPEDRHALADGLRDQLARHFAEPATMRHLAAQGDLTRVRIGEIGIAAGSRPQRIGALAARGIARGLKS